MMSTKLKILIFLIFGDLKTNFEKRFKDFYSIKQMIAIFLLQRHVEYAIKSLSYK